MYKIINKQIKGLLYTRLIEYCCERCDKVSFHVPNNTKMNEKILNSLNNLATTIYKGNYYSGFWKTDMESTIFVLPINDNVKKIILFKATNIYDWITPKLPEDMHFHLKNKCFLSITAHEEISLFYPRDDNDITSIKKIGIHLSDKLQFVSNDLNINSLVTK